MNNYFYIDLDGVQHGPLPLNQLVEKQCLRPETMVWNSTLVDWQRADSVDGLNEALAATNSANMGNTPPPHPNNNDSKTSQQGSYYYQNYQNQIPPKPENWLVWNILATVLCCGFIPGIVGIIYSSKVDNYWAMGLYSDAMRAANTAKIMFFVSLGLYAITALWNVGSLFALFIPIMAGVSNGVFDFNICGFPF